MRLTRFTTEYSTGTPLLTAPALVWASCCIAGGAIYNDTQTGMFIGALTLALDAAGQWLTHFALSRGREPRDHA